MIRYPFLWFTELIGSPIRLWDYFDVEGIMLNAYDIIKKKKAEEVAKVGVHKYLGFEGYIAIDSGGYLFMKNKKVPITPEELVEYYERWKPNFAVVLDHPIHPLLSSVEVRKRQEMTLEYTKIIVETKKTGNPVIIPVIHGYERTSLRWYIRKLERLGEFDIYGLGSLVPFVRPLKGVKGGLKKALEIVYEVKKRIEDRKLHVFGIGSSITMHLVFYAGADSLDSSSWRSKASMGAIQFPGIGDRYITGKASPKKYPSLSSSEKKILKECDCPICKNLGYQKLKEKFEYRAIHNAYVLLKELHKAREYLKNGEYENYLKNLVTKNKVYNKAFERIIQIRNG